jgi:hypothetical protein
MSEPSKIRLSEDLQDSLRDICKSCEDEDKEIRKALIRNYKKAEEFWHGVQFLFWSAHDENWRSPADMGFEDSVESEELGSFSDKVVDIYKAHGESIISALAAQLPALRFLPDDADSTEDTLTARTYNKIADLVQRHNKAKMVFLRALFFLANHGIVASYRYKESDESYGTYKVPVYGEEEVELKAKVCQDCGYNEELQPDADVGATAPTEQTCPNCGGELKDQKSKQTVPVQLSIEDRPKSRVKLDIFGALHFKVSYYARNQAECSYLGLFLDQGKDVTCSNFPDLTEDIQAESNIESAERFARASFVSSNEEYENKNLITTRRWWLRPVCFYRETSKDLRNKLLKKFPDGCKVTFLGRKSKIFADVQAEKLDDSWEIGQSGLGTYIYTDAILRPLIQIQEMRNQLVNLIIETIEHGIPSDFARPDVVNFDTYNRFEAVPGYIYKAMPGRPGEALSAGFYTSSRATLSREVAMFLKQLDQDAQFSIGSFPSIYGGPSEGKSRTFAEYAASRQMALQRLSIVWQFIVDWWTRTIAGAVKQYAECIVEDEKFTKFESGNYVNVWIKRSQMTGKVGGVEPEASESFPMSLSQKKDLLMKLMELNNEFVNKALYAPENVRILQDALALIELKIPGETQRVKQVIEINEMLKTGPDGQQAEPIPSGVPGPDGQEILQSTVPIDPDIDDHAVHAATLIAFMVDVTGLDVKRDNPKGYANLLAHLKAHQAALLQQTLATSAQAPQPGAEPETAQVGPE